MTATITSNTLGVNVFTAPGKAMVGERLRPFGEALGFDASQTPPLERGFSVSCEYEDVVPGLSPHPGRNR